MPEREPVKITGSAAGASPCREYDEQLGESYPVYPDLKSIRNIRPGRPFKRRNRRAAPAGARRTGRPPPGDCRLRLVSRENA